MTKKNLLIAIIGIISLTSCSDIIFRMEGRRPLHLETTKKINSTFEKFNLPKENLLFTHTHLEETNTSNFFNNAPDIYIADSNGFQKIYHEKNPTCLGPVENYLRNLCTNYPEWIDSSTTDHILENLLYKRDSTVFKINKSDKTRVYIAWKVTDHSLLKEKLQWDATLKNLKDCQYEIYWVNVDILAKNLGYKRRKRVKLEVPMWKMIREAKHNKQANH
jgi:hypothetical protein